MSNRIIIPANYDVDITIKYSSTSGQTELQVRNRSKVNLSMLQVATLLSQHNAELMKGLVTGTAKAEIVKESTTPPNGGDHAA